MSMVRMHACVAGLLLFTGACGGTWGSLLGTEKEPEANASSAEAAKEDESADDAKKTPAAEYVPPPGEGLACDQARCAGDAPLCAKVEDAWVCVGENDPAMFKNECLTADDCGAGEMCCAGFNTRCVKEGECAGGDTPVPACSTDADCPDMHYGMKVKGCGANEDSMPGLKVCQIN